MLRPELEHAGIKAEFSGRAKHLYSIHKKMMRKGTDFSEIYDVYAIRVIVESLRDCYAALGLVHAGMESGSVHLLAELALIVVLFTDEIGRAHV